MENKIVRIVLTGGPCAGKSTALTYLRQKLEQKGLIVLMVPEAATLCIVNGISPMSDIVGGETAQRAITSLTRQLENVWLETASALVGKGNVVILYDRGIPDSSAYVSKELYDEILEKLGIHPTQARDDRYDAVIHLRTAADGAEAFYTLVNNAARHETPEQARIQDEKTLNIWTGHPHLRVIDNSTDFEGKLRRVYAEVCQIIGIPVPTERERKFLVSFDPKNIPANAQRIDIEQVYLVSPDPTAEIRLRKRGQHGFYTYYETSKFPSGPGERLEIEKTITESEYLFGLKFRRPDTAPIRKVRTCFVHKNQYFELDEFEKAAIGGYSLLELEITDPDAVVDFPDWITIIREVTDNPRYSNAKIAQILASQAAPVDVSEIHR